MPMPDDEAARLAALLDLQVLDSAAEPEFDALVRAAALACEAPIARLSLVDATRAWFKAGVGLEGLDELPREQAFCAHAIAGGELFEVMDAALDARFAATPAVSGAPGLRFYAGACLRLSDGSAIGTLCVLDRRPRRLTPPQREILISLAKAATHALESRRYAALSLQAAKALAERDARLQASEERLSIALDSGQIGIWEFDLRSGALVWDAWMFRLHGLTEDAEVASYARWVRCLHNDDRQRIEQELQRAIVGRLPLDSEFRVVWPDGSVHHLRASARVTRDDQGRALSMVGAIWDLTAVHQMAAAMATQMGAVLAEQHELLLVTLRSIGDAVITADAAGRVVWLNPTAERLTGWAATEAKGRALEQVFHIVDERSRAVIENPVAACLARGELLAQARHTLLISRGGEEFGVQDSVAPIRNDKGDIFGVVLVFHDVTEQRRLSGEMTYRATHDQLTGLINRSEFEARLRRVLAQAQGDRSQHALLYIDLDQFKLVNDACGHAVGDQLLQQVARVLGEAVRTRDTLARLGGDEFAVLLEHCSPAQAQRVAQQICDRMEEFRFLHDERRFRIGASIGLVPITGRWASAAAILQAADTSCYAAKEQGRNRVHTWFDTDLTLRARHGEMQWTNRIEQALDEGRFVLYAQRIEALHLPAMDQPGLHAEVLLRMLGADGDLVLPSAFLPAAERFNLATRIDRWVLRHVIDWMKAEPALAAIALLSVNLSGQSIGDRAFHRWALEALAEAGPEVCRRLCIEITETAAITSLADAALFIAQVRGLGLRGALDDFGAGASSFGYLKSLPVDYLKIDGQFVRDLVDDALDEAAVRCFVDVAQVVGMQTVAEFVDSPAVLARLREIGVNFAQGFLQHEPMPLSELIGSKLNALQATP